MKALRLCLVLMLAGGQLTAVWTAFSDHQHSAGQQLGDVTCYTDHSDTGQALASPADSRPDNRGRRLRQATTGHVHNCVGCQLKVRTAGAHPSTAARLATVTGQTSAPILAGVTLQDLIASPRTSRGPPSA